jgi:hypothetical protein
MVQAWRRMTPDDGWLRRMLRRRTSAGFPQPPRINLDRDVAASKFTCISDNVLKGRPSMRKLLFAAVAFGGLTALAATGASAAPSAAGVRLAPSHPVATHVDYYHNRHHWHHRRREHNRWRYWN